MLTSHDENENRKFCSTCYHRSEILGHITALREHRIDPDEATKLAMLRQYYIDRHRALPR
jgi:hypothetical protein